MDQFHLRRLAREFEKRVFGVILYFASEEGTISLPSNEAGILVPFAYAVVEYSGGRTEEMPTSPNYLVWVDNWTDHVNEAVESALAENKKEFSSQLAMALKDLLSVKWQSDHGESWWTSGIERQAIVKPGFTNHFYISHADVLAIQNDMGKNMAPSDLEHCKQVGLLMRKHIAG